MRGCNHDMRFKSLSGPDQERLPNLHVTKLSSVQGRHGHKHFGAAEPVVPDKTGRI